MSSDKNKSDKLLYCSFCGKNQHEGPELSFVVRKINVLIEMKEDRKQNLVLGEVLRANNEIE